MAEQALDYIRDEGTANLKSDTYRFYSEQNRVQLADAARTYQDLVDLLTAKIQAGKASEEERTLQRTARFFTAECRFEQGLYREVLDIYNDLAATCRDRVEILHALSGQRKCHYANREEARHVRSWTRWRGL